MIYLSIAGGMAEIVLDAPHKLNALDEQALADLARRMTTPLPPPHAARSGRCCCAARDAPFAPAGTSPASTETDDAQALPGRTASSPC